MRLPRLVGSRCRRSPNIGDSRARFEELGGAIIEIAPNVMQNGMFGTGGLLPSIYPPVVDLLGFPRAITAP
jgi:hypothetical protein